MDSTYSATSPFLGQDEVAKAFVQERFCQVTLADTDSLYLSPNLNGSDRAAFDLLPNGVSKHLPLMQAIFFREYCMNRLAQTVVTESGKAKVMNCNAAEKEEIFFAAHRNFLVLVTQYFGREDWCKKIAEDRNPICLYRIGGLMDDDFVATVDFQPTRSMRYSDEEVLA